jgi:hypothetical protein
VYPPIATEFMPKTIQFDFNLGRLGHSVATEPGGLICGENRISKPQSVAQEPTQGQFEIEPSPSDFSCLGLTLDCPPVQSLSGSRRHD